MRETLIIGQFHRKSRDGGESVDCSSGVVDRNIFPGGLKGDVHVKKQGDQSLLGTTRMVCCTCEDGEDC